MMGTRDHCPALAKPSNPTTAGWARGDQHCHNAELRLTSSLLMLRIHLDPGFNEAPQIENMLSRCVGVSHALAPLWFVFIIVF
jgi:hypothetical protein